MPSPGWIEQLVTETTWNALPMNWLLDGSTGQGQEVAVSYGEGVIVSSLASGPDPGWVKCDVTPATWTECDVTPATWIEVPTDA